MVTLHALVDCASCGETFDGTWTDDSLSVQDMAEPPEAEQSCPDCGFVQIETYPGWMWHSEALSRWPGRRIRNMRRLPPLTLELLPLDRMELILAKAVRRVELPDAGLCWPWQWGADKDGYALVIRRCEGHPRHLRVSRLVVAVADRIAYADVDQACHACDNPPCINPDHVWNGSNSANQQDMIAKGRQAWTPAQHGTPSKYVKSCRCIPCRTAMLEYSQQRKQVQNPTGLRRDPEVREQVRQLYLETGLGQRELAAQVGIPYQTIAKWVNGLRPPMRDALGRFG